MLVLLLLSNFLFYVENDQDLLSQNSDKDKEIKYIMNKTYHTLVESFINESYSADFIKSTIAKTIKVRKF